MENNKNVRLIDELGRVVLPIEVRQAMDWGNKTPVEIWVNVTEDELVMKRHVFSCIYCGATENLKTYQKKHICPSCQTEISNL